MSTTKKARSVRALLHLINDRPQRGITTSTGNGMAPALFVDLIASVRDERQASRRRAGAPADETPDPAELRRRLGLTQAVFAHLLGVSRRTLEAREQARQGRRP